MQAKAQQRPSRTWIWPVLFLVGLAAAIMFSNTHADTTSSGIHIIRTPDEYQTVLNEADGLFKDRMIKVDKAEPLTSDDLNKLKQAQTLYEELNVFKPIKMGPVFALGRIDLTLGEISTAEDRFRQAILNAQLEDNKALGPSIKALTGESYYFLAQCLEQQNDWKGALEQINQGIAINKDSPNYYYVRAPSGGAA